MIQWTDWIGEVAALIMGIVMTVQKVRQGKREETTDKYDFSVKHVTQYNKLVDLFEQHLQEILQVKQNLAQVTLDLEVTQKLNSELQARVLDLEAQAMKMNDYIKELEAENAVLRRRLTKCQDKK